LTGGGGAFFVDSRTGSGDGGGRDGLKRPKIGGWKSSSSASEEEEIGWAAKQAKGKGQRAQDANKRVFRGDDFGRNDIHRVVVWLSTSREALIGVPL
jgi:hypothetical protein